MLHYIIQYIPWNVHCVAIDIVRLYHISLWVHVEYQPVWVWGCPYIPVKWPCWICVNSTIHKYPRVDYPAQCTFSCIYWTYNIISYISTTDQSTLNVWISGTAYITNWYVTKVDFEYNRGSVGVKANVTPYNVNTVHCNQNELYPIFHVAMTSKINHENDNLSA